MRELFRAQATLECREMVQQRFDPKFGPIRSGVELTEAALEAREFLSEFGYALLVNSIYQILTSDECSMDNVRPLDLRLAGRRSKHRAACSGSTSVPGSRALTGLAEGKEVHVARWNQSAPSDQRLARSPGAEWIQRPCRRQLALSGA